MDVIKLTPELEDEIVMWIERGRGLMAYERYNKDIGLERPCRRTISRWRQHNAEFDAKCTKARELAGEAAAEESDEICELVLRGELDPHSARVVLSHKQWKASKLAHKVYGDATTIKGDADNPLTLNLATRLDNAIKLVSKPTPLIEGSGEEL